MTIIHYVYWYIQLLLICLLITLEIAVINKIYNANHDHYYEKSRFFIICRQIIL